MEAGGGHPHPLSRFPPLQRPIRRQASAPRHGLPRPRNSPTPSFRGKKIRAAGSAAEGVGRARTPGRTQVRAGVLARHATPPPPQPRKSESWIATAVEVSGGLIAVPARAGRTGHGDLAKLSRVTGDARSAWAHACPGARSCFAHNLEIKACALALPARAGASATPRQPGWGRAGWVGEGPARAGEDVSLRACARGAPRFNCRA